MKKCTNPNCKHKDELQPLTNFYKQRPMADGLSNECIDCKKVRQKKWSEKKKQNNEDFFKLLVG